MVTVEIKGQEYKLRLTTFGVVQLEDKLGKNPVDMFIGLSEGQLPKIREVVYTFHQALQPYNANMNLEKASMLLDDYIEDGHTIFELLSNEIMKLFTEAGLLARDDEVTDNPN